MADRVITAEALITAKDGTGDVFARIGAKLSNVGKSAKSSSAINEMSRSLDNAAKRLKELDKLQAGMSGFAKSRATFNQSRAALEAHARAMRSVEKPTKEMSATYERLQGVVSRASAAFEKQAGAMSAAKRAAESFGGPLNKISAEQARLRGVIDSTTKAIEHQALAEHKAAAAAHKNANEQNRVAKASEHRAKHGFGDGVNHGVGHMTGVAGLVGGYGVISAAEHAAETYREFDKERRYQKAVMAISDAQQEPLIKQAIEGGASSRYNDIQWLEAQRELAARGLNAEQVMGITPIAADLGQATDKTLPEAARMLEGGMFGFGKDVSTYEKARSNALRTADLQVKASKISGMTAEDIVAGYKYAAAPARMAGLSEEQMLAFLAVGKKANMPGNETGTAIRALGASLLKPTAGARTALLANGIDFSKFQKMGARPMEIEPFAKSIAASYGVSLSDDAKGALKKLFDDKSITQDASKFMPAVMGVLSDQLGGDDAKSKKSIAGEARRYRDASMAGVDVQGLLNAIIPKISENKGLANLLFGSKQGGRLGLIMSQPEVLAEKLDQLQNHSQGYSKTISTERMAGYDGAMYKLTGAKANVETAIGRGLDNNGKGGFLTAATSGIAAGSQAFVEAPVALQRLAVEAGAAATAFAALKGAQSVLDGFGLKTSAAALDHAAVALEGAAARLGGSAALGAEGAALNAAEGVGGKGNRFLRAAGKIGRSLPLVGTAVIAGQEALSWLLDQKAADPNAYRGGARAAHAYGLDTSAPSFSMGPYGINTPPPPASHFVSAPRRGSSGYWLNDAPLHPALAPIADRIGSLPTMASIGSLGGGSAAGPVDVTGKVQLEGQATVAVSVKVDGGSVTNTTSSARGNIKISTGSTMPGAKSSASGSANIGK